MKIDPSGKASKLFMAIPSELTLNASRYTVNSPTDGDGRHDRLRETNLDMQDSLVVNIAYHASDPNVGMALHKDTNRYKKLIADTGLFIILAFDLFCEKFSSRINKRYLIYTRGLHREEKIVYLPVYMTLFL